MTNYARPVRGIVRAKRGDSAPGFELLLPSWVNPVGASATLFMTDRRTGMARLAAPCSLTTVGTDVVAQYVWAPNDLGLAGIFSVEVEVALAGGIVATFPDAGYLTFVVEADLGTGAPPPPPPSEGAMVSAGVGTMSAVGSTVPNTAGAMAAAGVGTMSAVGSSAPIASGAMTSAGVGTMSPVGSSVPSAAGAMSSAGVGTMSPVGALVQSLGITAFSRDRGIYDSGAALGVNTAAVPVSGTGTDGVVVQARALSVDDAGATSTAWVDIATIAGGVWSGTINAPRSASWYKPEVRIKTNTAVSAQGTNRFGVGHVIAIWGQSEISHMANSFYSGVAPVSVADPEAVQVYHFTTGFTPGTGPANLNRRFISDTTPVTAALAAMAATFIASRPGDKFAVILQAVQGTSFTELVNDSNTNRYWSDDLALHNLATSDGAKVGVAMASWFAAPGSLGTGYADAFFQIIAGKTLAGAAVTIPGTITHATGTYHADHQFSEIYDYAFTKWLAYGPHRFEPLQDLQDALHVTGGGIYTGAQNKQDCRDGWRAVPTNPNATMFLPTMGMEPMNYQNGRDNGAGGWTDEIHPGTTADGSALWARLNALTFLKAAGLASWAIPKFDNCLWESSGAYVEVWSSAGAVTTTRLARGDAALPATYSHWTEVWGFQINGAPAQNATIVAGRVRITKNGGGSFIFSDNLTFGDGNAGGEIKYPQDTQNAAWENYPIVNVSAPGVNGIAVMARPDSSVLANTLPASPQFTTVAGQLTRFTDTANWPTTGGKITFALDMMITSFAATSYIAEMANLHVSLQVATDGRIFLSVKDSAATAIMSSVQLGTVTINTRFDLIVALDLAANSAWTTLNGTTTSRTLAANTGNLASATRKFTFLSRSSGTTGNTIGTIYKLEVWADSQSGGGRLPTDTNLRTNGRIIGPAATANAHPWKAGGNVV